MPLSMYDASVPVFVRTLTQLRWILGKAAADAQARNIDDEVLAQARLYPDMFPLVNQVQIATDMARGCAARLTGGEPPKEEDNERTLAELCARVDRALAFLGTLKPDQFSGAETRAITRPVRGQPKTFTGINYLQQFILPNVYFHAATAYAILRHNGVPLGKADFIGKLD
jgi:hypothetical protein